MDYYDDLFTSESLMYMNSVITTRFCWEVQATDTLVAKRPIPSWREVDSESCTSRLRFRLEIPIESILLDGFPLSWTSGARTFLLHSNLHQGAKFLEMLGRDDPSASLFMPSRKIISDPFAKREPPFRRLVSVRVVL